MTIEEALEAYEPKVYITSKGDNLMKIIDNLYTSRDSIYYYVIDKLNPAISEWYPSGGLNANTEIKYFTSNICSLIYEVTG